MAKIEIGLRAIVGDVNFAVLIGTHRPRIDIQIGVQLPQTHGVTARLQKRAKSRGSQAFS
jgi:hypothetical protein